MEEREEVKREERRNELLFPYAPQADILRSYQKDQYYKKFIADKINEASSSWLGQRLTLRYQKELNFLGSLAYFTLNTLRGKQTLGEEFCDIQLINENTNTFVDMKSRLKLMWWAELFPYLFGKFSTLLGIITRPKYSLQNNTNFLTSLNLFIQKVFQSYRTIEQYFQKFHLAIFYFNGSYYELAKRIANIRYIYIQFSPFKRSQYHILGVLIYIQLIISCYSFLKKLLLTNEFAKLEEEWKSAEDNEEINQPNCTLCLEPRKNTTATTCGHLFCWSCIHDSCLTKSECPLCRQPITPQSLTRIYHYSYEEPQ